MHTGVTVGVIDSGWDRTIEDARVLPGIGITSADDPLTLDRSFDDHDRNGHGTAASDLVLQVAPDARIVPIRVFGARLETSPRALVTAIDWAVEQRLSVLNVSLGTVRKDAVHPLYRACERARRAGVLVVAAAANSPTGLSYPAVFDAVVSVRSADVPNRLDFRYYPDEAFECGARGARQEARGLGGRSADVTGTSFAAPVVSGHVARLLARHGRSDLETMRELLRAEACEDLEPTTVLP